MIDTPRPRRYTSLAIALAAIVIAIIVWHVPAFDGLLYPLRLFVTFVHESGHGLAAIISGGQFGNLTVYPDGSGVAATMGGASWLILPAGYLGAALFGAGLFFIANTTRRTRTVSGVLAIVLAVIALLTAQWFSTAWLVGLGFAIVLGLLAWKGSPAVNLWVLNVLAVLCALNAVVDLWTVVTNSGASLGDVRNDAAAFTGAYAPLLPAWLIALCWAGLAVVLLGLAVWYSVGRSLRRAVNDSVATIQTPGE